MKTSSFSSLNSKSISLCLCVTVIVCISLRQVNSSTEKVVVGGRPTNPGFNLPALLLIFSAFVSVVLQNVSYRMRLQTLWLSDRFTYSWSHPAVLQKHSPPSCLMARQPVITARQKQNTESMMLIDDDDDAGLLNCTCSHVNNHILL